MRVAGWPIGAPMVNAGREMGPVRRNGLGSGGSVPGGTCWDAVVDMPIVLGFALSCVVLNLVPGPGMKFTIAQGGQARSSAVRQALRADRGASNGAAG
jgi:hypothetical protein